nr:hypothetical protein [uncultured Bacteroides sp.]
MKWMLLLSFIVLGGMIENDTASSKVQPNRNYTSCILTADLTKQELKNYNYRGICLPKVNGQGYACVKKGLFKKGNCVGMRIVPEDKK